MNAVSGSAPGLKVEAFFGDIPAFESTEERLDAYLNRMGAIGWELISVNTLHDAKGREHLVLFFKHRK